MPGGRPPGRSEQDAWPSTHTVIQSSRPATQAQRGMKLAVPRTPSNPFDGAGSLWSRPNQFEYDPDPVRHKRSPGQVSRCSPWSCAASTLGALQSRTPRMPPGAEFPERAACEGIACQPSPSPMIGPVGLGRRRAASGRLLKFDLSPRNTMSAASAQVASDSALRR